MLDTNRAVLPQNMVRILKYWIYEVEGLYYRYVAKSKALISCVSAPLFSRIRKNKNRSFHDADHISSPISLSVSGALILQGIYIVFLLS